MNIFKSSRMSQQTPAFDSLIITSVLSMHYFPHIRSPTGTLLPNYYVIVGTQIYPTQSALTASTAALSPSKPGS